MRCFAVFAIFAVCAVPAYAEFARVTDGSRFMELVRGKTLTYPLVRLVVTDDGRIVGTGASREVTGRWQWRNGFFCRDLRWGDRELGFNCQEVKVKGGRMRFTSDEGLGQTAVFRLE